ncbi:M28 family peptidase [Streptomyces fuscigenes]|nr:M28 family peptidase [Streptomyces fuscigenes]
MLCLESVGYFDTAPGSQRLPRGARLALPGAAAELEASGLRGDFTLVVHRRSSRAAAEAWRDAARAAVPPLRSLLLRDPRADGRIGAALGYAVPVLNNLSRSDHAPFWTRRVPALLLTGTADFRNAHYHRPTDTPGTLDYGRLAAVATATAATAVNWPRR